MPVAPRSAPARSAWCASPPTSRASWFATTTGGGGRADWESAVIKYLPNAASRTAALLSGTVDMIDTPSPNDLPRLQSDPRFGVFSRQGMRLVYLAPNQAAEVAPFSDKANTEEPRAWGLMKASAWTDTNRSAWALRARFTRSCRGMK